MISLLFFVICLSIFIFSQSIAIQMQALFSIWFRVCCGSNRNNLNTNCVYGAHRIYVKGIITIYSRSMFLSFALHTATTTTTKLTCTLVWVSIHCKININSKATVKITRQTPKWFHELYMPFILVGIKRTNINAQRGRKGERERERCR